MEWAFVYFYLYFTYCVRNVYKIVKIWYNKPIKGKGDTMKELLNNLGKKKLITILFGFVGVIVFVILILLGYNFIFGRTSFSSIENKLSEAARDYYSTRQDLLPKNDNEEVSITDQSLTEAGYLKSMAELTKKLNATCTATVLVNYAGGNYRYTPILDCGDKYSSQTLTSYIKEHESVVYTGAGLYDLNGELVYRGENPNNYVSFSGKSWRIVKLENDQVVLILNQKGEKTVWDDRYNNDRKRNDGINDYSVSRIFENVQKLYDGNSLFTSNAKSLLATHSLYIGRRGENDSINNGSIEKSTRLDNQVIGLLPLYDYINASIDSNCSNVNTSNCSNYNYLNYYQYSWWSLTADSSNTYKAYRVEMNGTITTTRASSNGYIRPVVYLAKDVLYASGDGTSENPYIIK